MRSAAMVFLFVLVCPAAASSLNQRTKVNISPVEKDYAIKDGKESMEELSATITDTSAGIESAAAKIEDLSTKISDTESELSTATALRKKENEEFVKKEAELLETTRELEGATTAIKNSLSP